MSKHKGMRIMAYQPAKLEEKPKFELKYDGTEAQQIASALVEGRITSATAKTLKDVLGLEAHLVTSREERKLAAKELALKILAHSKGLNVVDVTPKLTK